jgi:hypothetical protein
MSEEVVPVATEEQKMDIDDLIQKGDFSSFTMREKSIFTYQLALRLGLNPLTKPFDFIVLNNKLVLYANRTCSDQLRKIHNITSTVLYEGPLQIGTEIRADVYCVRVRVGSTNDQGQLTRSEEHIGCVGMGNKKDEELGNTIMKCHTKALRRATIAFCGLGFLDELEVESVKGLEGSAGNPRRVAAPLPMLDEAMNEAPATPPMVVTPVRAAVPSVKPLPQANASSAQPAAPKLPSVLPAVKP